MNLLLVDNLILPDRTSLASMDVHPHLGLLALAAVAEAHGHRTAIYDPKREVQSGRLPLDDTLYERVAGELLAGAPDAVGFTTLGCSFLFALNVAACLKRIEPGLPILLGGPHATLLHRPILERFTQFDLVARHECDEILPALLDALPARRFEHIPGLSWREGSRLRMTEGRPKVDDLDSLPLLDYDHYPVTELGLDLLRIEAGRGCPFLCSFCSTAGFFQRSFRLKSAPRLVMELDRLHQRYGVSDFKLDHDMFTVNRHKVLEFCQAVRGRGYRWHASARMDCVDEPLLEAMAGAGCVNLYFGIETGSPRMQRLCAKGLDLALVDPVLRTTERLGMETTVSFITGFPQETEEDQDQTLDMLGRLHGRRRATQLHVLAPEPGTPLFEEHREALAYDGYGCPYNTEFLGPGDEALVRSFPDVFPTYHHYRAAMPRWRYAFATEAVAALRRLGPRVLPYLLRVEGGRLSRLLADWRSFELSRRDEPVPDADDLQAYLDHRFGPCHHLASLARLALCLHSRGAGLEASGRIPVAPFDPATPYRLHSSAVVLVDEHDGGEVLQRIEHAPPSGGLLDDSLFERRCSYLVAGSGENASSWIIDPGVAAILSLFESPRPCGEVMAWLHERTGGMAVDGAFFADLVDRQVLVADSPGERA